MVQLLISLEERIKQIIRYKVLKINNANYSFIFVENRNIYILVNRTDWKINASGSIIGSWIFWT